ncbi:LuxR C-terminal-related transcriptional regulator [Chloroflexi bacterium TSY]|nr:LuxR C-terminal-related transcriptional regulator [Chloroflexi bacterium TSY]
MAIPILQTKLYIPPPHPAFVSRARLVERLNKGLQRKLTLIAAPAGAGKTTLVSDWFQQLNQFPAWLSLDEADSDATRFWLYIIAALQTVRPDLGRAAQTLLEAPVDPPFETVLISLINEIAASPDRIILVLDDYHLIDAAEIHQTLNFLLDHLSPQLHLVVLTREDPPLPLARLRVQQQMTEIRVNDLRFTTDETGQFLNQTMGLALNLAQIQALEQRTEGWVAGLQMAALSLQNVSDAADFIERFSGDDRYVVDYLMIEVLEGQPAHVQEFLLQTAILQRLTAPLCEAVTERDEGHETLIYLEQAGLFLIALDNQRIWYRYHHLFADLLRYRLTQELSASEIQQLHQRAAAWFAKHELIDEALRHNLAAEDFGQAAALVESNILRVLKQGQLRKVGKWFDALPESIIQVRPFLCVYHAWVLLLMGQVEAMETRLQDAERAQQTAADLSTTLGKEIRAHIAAMYAYVARRQGKIDEGLQLLRQALADLPEDNRIIQNVVRYNLGFTHLLAGQIKPAIQFLQQARRDALALDNIYTAASAASDLAAAYIIQGRLTDAAALYEEEIAAGLARNHGQPFPLAGIAYAGLGQILYERNDLQAAEESIDQAIQLGELLTESTIIFDGLVSMAWLKATQRDEPAAQVLWKRATSLAQQMGDRMREAYVATCQVRAWLRQNANCDHLSPPRQAIEWTRIHQEQQPDTMDHQECFSQLTLAWFELTQNQPGQAFFRLTSLAEIATSRGWTDNLIKILALQALAHSASGELDSALEPLSRACDLAASEGYVRIFLDYGLPMQRLLQQAAERGMAPAYITNLLTAFTSDATVIDTTPARSPIPNLQSPIPDLIEPLKEREQQILRLMAANLMHQQIADELHLSLNTVKWHARNLYGKLGVSRRAAAIDRARELGIL